MTNRGFHKEAAVTGEGGAESGLVGWGGRVGVGGVKLWQSLLLLPLNLQVHVMMGKRLSKNGSLAAQQQQVKSVRD